MSLGYIASGAIWQEKIYAVTHAMRIAQRGDPACRKRKREAISFLT